MDASLFEFHTVTESISLCFVHIPLFAADYVGVNDLPEFRRMKSMVLDTQGPLSAFFQPQDIDRINQYKVLKKQVEWMAGKVAVKQLAALAGLCPEPRLVISAHESGAPYLPDFPGASITISHSGDYAVAGLDTRGGNLAVDIEAIETGRMQNIMRVAFSEKEIQRYKNSDDATLYLNWTVKEAYLKYIKKGFSEGLKGVEIIDGRVLHRGRTVDHIVMDSCIVHDTYAMTLIYQRS